MKKILYFAAIMLIAVFTSCASDDPVTDGGGNGGGATINVKESWTVMFYSVGGKTLDMDQVSNMGEAFLASQSDKINMTFQFKFSKGGQDTLPENLKGAFRFDMKANRANVSVTDATKGSLAWLSAVNTSKVDDGDFSKGSTLAEFIKWSKNLHPADHYLLILSDHGAGYSIFDDSTQTRSILQDDNFEDYRQLSLDNTISGIQSGMGGTKLDAIYTDACLMETAENLYSYSDVSKAFLGAEELTPAEGGDYTLLLNSLAVYSTDFKDAAKAYIDNVVGNRWINSGCADLGYYDLTNFETVMTPIKNLSNALKATIEKGDPTELEKLKQVVCTSQLAQNNYNNGTKLDSTQYTYGAHIGFQALPDGNAVTVGDCQAWISRNSENWAAILGNPTDGEDPVPDNISKMIDECGENTTHQVTLANFMMLLSQQIQGGYTDIYNSYISALKTVAYIKNTTALDPYDYTSMSINLFNMTENGVKQGQIEEGQTTRRICDICTFKQDSSTGALTDIDFKPINVSQYSDQNARVIQNIYHRTKFDKATNWMSNFLMWEDLPNPGLFLNPSLEVNSKTD